MGNMYTKFDDPNFICIVLLSWLPIEVWPWHWETTDIFLPPWGTCVPGLIILIGTLYILLPSRCWYMNRHIHCTKLSYNLSLIIEYVYQAYCFVPTEFYSCKFDFEKTIGCLFPLIIRNIVYLMVEDSNHTSNVFIWHTQSLIQSCRPLPCSKLHNSVWEINQQAKVPTDRQTDIQCQIIIFTFPTFLPFVSW